MEMKSENEICYPILNPETYSMLQGLGSINKLDRDNDFRILSRTIDSWFLGVGSPNINFLENSIEVCSSNNNTLHYLIEQLLPNILRLSLTAPYDDVRENCHNILVSLEKKGIRIPRSKYSGPSHFIPLNEVEHFSILKNEDGRGENEHLFRLFVDHFEEWGRIENYIALMGFHPVYLEQYMKMYNHLFRGDGSLPYLDRFYVAIMAAAQMHCKELIYRFTTEFLAAGGNPVWLQGLSKAPSRLRALSELNQHLCHQPWLIEPKNIQQLIHSPKGLFHISMSQLMQAVVIMTHVYSLSSFILVCGVNHEIDHPPSFVWPNSTNSDASNSPRNTPNNENLQPNTLNDVFFSSFTNHTTNNVSHSETDEDSSDDNHDDCPLTVLMERLRLAQEDDDELAVDDVAKMFLSVEKENETIIKNPIHPKELNPLIKRFIEDQSFTYVSYNSKNTQVLRIQEYSWSDEACCLADRFYPDIGRALEDKFNCSYELTYNTMGDRTNIDTTLFRLSVWIYVHSLYGIRHDDFNYSQMDNLLTAPLKLFLKKAVTKPCTAKKADLYRFFPEFKISEKVHMALMAADARQQACLLHILKAMQLNNS